MFEIMVLENHTIISPITLHGGQAMMDTVTGVRGGAVLVAAGAGGGVAVLPMDAAKVDRAAGAGVGATVAAGVLNERRAVHVARAELVEEATVEVEVEAGAEVVVANRVEPGAGQGARAGHVAVAEKGAEAGGEAEEGVMLGAAVSVVVVAVVAAAPVGVVTAVSTGESNQVILGSRRRTLLSLRRLGDARKFRICL